MLLTYYYYYYYYYWVNTSLEIASIYSFEDKEMALFYPILPISGAALFSGR
jgi:hypothetical protein